MEVVIFEKSEFSNRKETEGSLFAGLVSLYGIGIYSNDATSIYVFFI